MDRIGGPDAEAVLRLLGKLAEGSPAAALKGKQLLDLSSDVQECCIVRNTPTEPDLRREHFLLACVGTSGLLLLLSKVLLSRKRVREWRQQQYSSRVCSLLRASTAALKLLHLTRQGGQVQYQCSIPDSTQVAAAELDRVGTLEDVAAAQADVAQLLSACRQQQQQQQQQQPEGLPQLQQLAAELLAFWLEAHMLWLTCGDLSAGGPAGLAAFLQPAVDLAAVLAQTLTARSPGAQFVLVAQVAYRVRQVGMPLNTDEESSAAQLALWDSPAQLQLCVAIQVLHSYCLQHASSSASGSAAETGAAGAAGAAVSAATGRPDAAAIDAKTLELLSGMEASTATRVQDVLLAVQAATGWVLDTDADQAAVQAACSRFLVWLQTAERIGARLGRAAGAWHKEQQQQPSWQQQKEQLAAVTLQAWEAAGMAADALPAFAAAVRQHLAAPQPHRPGTATLEASTPRELSNVAQWIACCFNLHFTQDTDHGPCTAAPPTALPTRAFEQLSRHQQQLLQHVLWPLPQLLLQTVLLHCHSCGDMISQAASAAARIVAVWQLPGLYAAAVDASTASAGSAGSSGRARRGAKQPAAAAPAQPLQQRLVPLLDCWLLLMHQVLLQPQLGLLRQAASVGRVASGSALEAVLDDKQQCDCHNTFSAACCAAGSCGAAAAAVVGEPDELRLSYACSSSSSSILLSCRAADAAACLVALLQQLGGLHGPSLFPGGGPAQGHAAAQVPGSSISGSSAQAAAAAAAIRAAWRSKGAAVILVLEALMRHALPHHGLCLATFLTDRIEAQQHPSSNQCPEPSAGLLCSNTVVTLRWWLSECLGLDGILQAGQQQQGYQQQQQQRGVLAQLWSAAIGDGAQQLQARLCALHISTLKLSKQQPLPAVAAAIAAASSWLQGAVAAVTAAATAAAAAAAADGGVTAAAGDATAGTSAAAWAMEAAVGVDSPTEQRHLVVCWLVLLGHYAVQLGRITDAVLQALRASSPGEQEEGSLLSLSADPTDAQAQIKQAVLHALNTFVRGVEGEGASSAEWVDVGVVLAMLRACTAITDALAAGEAQVVVHLVQPLLPLILAGGSSGAGWPGILLSSSSTGVGVGVSVSSQDHPAVAHCTTLVIDVWKPVRVAAVTLVLLSTGCLELWATVRDALPSLQQDASLAGGPAHGRQLLVALQRSGILQAVSDKLLQLGPLLCGLLPVSWCCNNSRCLAVSGVSELQLVGGKACVCGGCMAARYCSRACQAEAAEQHRPICRQLTAARRLSEAAAAAPELP